MLILKNKKLSGVYAAFIIIYLLQILFVPVDKTTLAKYHVSVSSLRVITLSVALPYIIIWVITLIGYLRLNTYAELIKNNKDGAAFKVIAKGILWLGLWLPLSTIVNNFSSQYYTSHHSATANLVRFDNYLNLVFLIIGFVLISKGTNKLLLLIRKPALSMSQMTVLVYIAFSALYVLLTLHDSARALPTHKVAVASYYEPDWLLVVTLVIPRLIYWFLGVQAVHSIYIYRKKVKGKLYQQALNYLAIGLGGVVATTIILRCLQSLSSTLGQLSLAFLLAFIYVLLILISVGYVLIAKGARGLQRLEEL